MASGEASLPLLKAGPSGYGGGLLSLDSIPRPIRLLVGLLASIVLLRKAGLVGPVAGPKFSLVGWHQTLALALTGILVAVLVFKAYLRKIKKFPGATSPWRGPPAPSRPLAALRIKGLSEEASRQIASILRERSAASGLDYLVTTLIAKEGVDTLLIISGARESQVLIEKEIISTLAATLKTFRVEPVNDVPDEVNSIFYLFKPTNRSREAVIVGLSDDVEVAMKSNGARGSFHLGSTIRTPTPMPIRLACSDVAGHIAIFGSTGSGKSTTAAALACRLLSECGIPSIIIDWTGEYRRILAPCAPRIYDPVVDKLGVWPGVEEERDDILLEVLSIALDLTAPQAYMLQKVMSRERPGDIKELLGAIEGVPEDSKWDREVKRALLRKVGLLADKYPEVFSRSAKPLVDNSKSAVIKVVDLSSIRLTLAKRAYALLLLASEYYWRVYGGVDREAAYIADEAHNLMAGEGSIVEKLTAEARKYGMGLVLVTQSPLAAESILLNTNTKIVHALRSARDKALIIDSLGLERSHADLLDKLGVGEALVYSPTLSRPVFVRIELPKPLAKSINY